MLFSNPNEINPDRLAKHQLTRQPFLNELSSHDDFFTHNAVSMVINTINRTISQPENDLCLIKGEKGIGKSCLADYLHNHQQEHTTFLFQTKRRSNLALILKAIINDDDLQSDDTQHLAKQAAIEIFHALKNEKQPVLIIDDAHRLRENTLLTLIRFASAIKQQGVGKLKLVLLADKSIEKIIDKIPSHHIEDNGIYTVLLRPLSKSEIKEYLNHRVIKAGGNENLFNDKQIDNICDFSSGIPSHINTSAASILNNNYKKKLFSNKNFQLGGYIAAAIVFIGLAFLYTHSNTNKPTPGIAEPGTEIQAEPTTDIVDQPPVATENTSDEATKIEPIEDISLKVNSEELINNSTDKIADNTPIEETTSLTKDTEPEILQTIEIETLEVKAIDSVNTKTKENTKSSKEITDNTIYSHRWLLQQKPTGFVLQLLGTENYKKLMTFADTLVTNCTLSYFRTVRNQAAWHVLLCGPYEDSESATNDIRNLPVKVQKNRPWPRDIATIQQKIRTQ